jgi:toxin ParE1/3/4
VVKRYEIVFRREAIRDLIEIEAYVADQADLDIAAAYIDRLEAFCRKLDLFPERGTPRDDVRQGLRTIVYRRRVTIAYRIAEQKVLILRVLGPGRDIVAELSGS